MNGFSFTGLAILVVAIELFVPACSGSQSTVALQSTTRLHSQLLLYLTAPGQPTSPPAGTAGQTALNIPYTRFNEAQEALVYEKLYTGLFAVTPGSCFVAGHLLFTASFVSGSSKGPAAVLSIKSTRRHSPQPCKFTISDVNGQRATVTAYWEGG